MSTSTCTNQSLILMDTCPSKVAKTGKSIQIQSTPKDSCHIEKMMQMKERCTYTQIPTYYTVILQVSQLWSTEQYMNEANKPTMWVKDAWEDKSSLIVAALLPSQQQIRLQKVRRGRQQLQPARIPWQILPRYLYQPQRLVVEPRYIKPVPTLGADEEVGLQRIKRDPE